MKTENKVPIVGLTMMGAYGVLVYSVWGVDPWRSLLILLAVNVIVQCMGWLNAKGRENDDAL